MTDRTVQTTQFRVLDFSAEGADESGRFPVVVSTDAVVAMPDGSEILVHTPEAIDLSRAPLPIIVTHQGGQLNVGVVEDISISAGKMRGWARFGDRPEAAAYARDVVNKIIRSVSVGYCRIKGYIRADDVLVTTRWQPRHAALVAEPADVGAGFFRETSDALPPFELTDPPDVGDPQSRCIATDIPAPSAGAQPSEGERSMDKTEAPAAEQQTATKTEPHVDPLKLERERSAQIRAFGRQFGATELADKAIDNGMSVDAFRAQLLDTLRDNGKLRPAESPEIGMSKKDVESFSFCRALLAAADPLNAAKIAPFEMECSRAAQDKRDSADVRQKERETAITIPVDVLSRGIAVAPETAAAVARRLINAASQRSLQYQTLIRDLTAGTATAGGNVVATELLGSSFIELLRNAMVLDRIGVTFLRDLNGNVAIPSQTGAATGYWLAEGGAPTESQQSVGQVTFTPKTAGAFTDYTRRLLLQSSIDVEAFVRADLATILGLLIQAGCFNGSGTSNELLGLLNISGVGAVVGGTNGLAPTYDHMVDLETAVAVANADVGNLAYLTNAKVRGKLRKTQEFSSTNGKPVWTSGRERGIGEVLGYDAFVTNSVPSNLTKGTSSGVCSAIAFGNWSDAVLAMWGGLDIMLDPYANSTSGGKRVIALQDVDFNVRNVASFAVMKDALTA